MHSLPSAIIVWIHSPTVWRVPIIHWYQSTRHKRLLHRPSFLLLPEFLRQVISLALIITSTFQHNESVSSSCIQCHDGSNVLLSTPCIISTSLSIRRTAFCSMHSTRRSNILLNCTSCTRCRHTIYLRQVLQYSWLMKRSTSRSSNLMETNELQRRHELAAFMGMTMSQSEQFRGGDEVHLCR